MARKSDRTRRGFTLVELIVVIGLMGLLGTISIGGYFAASRGMAARGVVQGTASLIRQAMQTCLIDQTPTAVLFLNKRLNEKSENSDGYEAVGVAIAVKMVGRISYIAKGGCKTAQSENVSVGGGSMLIDEFADWNQSYSLDASEDEKQLSQRLYRMFSGKDGYNSLGSGLDKCCSLMCSWVGFKDLDADYMISARSKIGDWCAANAKEASHNRNASGIGYDNANSVRWGLPFHPKNEWLKVGDWQVGDAYGVEIATLELPKNYIFGSSVPSGVKLVPANSPSSGVLVFTPGMVQNAKGYKFSGVGSVQISMLNDMDGTDKTVVGTVDNDMLEDQN